MKERAGVAEDRKGEKKGGGAAVIVALKKGG